MKKMLLIFAVMLLTMGNACTKQPPEIVMVTPEPAAPSYPPECTSRDPAWVGIPDKGKRDVFEDEQARRDRANEANFNSVIGKRDVCRAAITAATKRG